MKNLFDSKEKKFWKWFEKHSQELLDSYDVDSEIWCALGDKLTDIAEGLMFEFSSNEGEKPKEFIISADGCNDLIGNVEKLYDAKPDLPNWKIIKFRPRLEGFGLKMHDGVEFDPDETRFVFVTDEDLEKVGVFLFVKDYDDEKEDEYFHAAMIYLQTLLGEYDFMLYVGGVAVDGVDSKYFPDSSPVTEMAEEFDRILGRKDIPSA